MTGYKTGILSIECLNKVSYNKVMDRKKAEKIEKYCIKNGVKLIEFIFILINK